MTHRRLVQLGWIVVAAALMAAAGTLHDPLDYRSEKYGLVAPASSASESHPEVALLSMSLGGLRAPIVNWLWQRADELKQAGQHHEAMQLADLICRLQPRFPGVWGFHAWNMAWNISVTRHSPEERWLWINQGIRLLRDKGIPLNPKALPLYKELGWIFWQKIAGTTDEMHLWYKRYWAAEMQQLLGAPPVGQAGEVIAAFRPVAQAPLNRDLRLQGKQSIQPDQLAVLLADPQVAAYAAELARLKVAVDRSLLTAYNRFSRDDAAASVRLRPPTPPDKAEQDLPDLINSPRHAAARGKMLAFVRAQILWNEYRMNAQWMLALMEKYDAPLDWRLPVTHALYWLTRGMEVCDSRQRTDVEAVNLARVVLDCLKELTWTGRLAYVADEDPLRPSIVQWSDWRYIKPAAGEYDAYLDAVREENERAKQKGEDEGVGAASLETGHINYYISAIQMLFAGGRIEQAQEMFDHIKRRYGKDDDDWVNPDVESFVISRLARDGPPVPEAALSLITSATVVAQTALAQGRKDVYDRYTALARRVYLVYWQEHQDVARLRMPPLEAIQARIIAQLLVRPETHGVRVALVDRANLYSKLTGHMFVLDGQVYSLQVLIYDQIAAYLPAQCADEGLNFEAAFPRPVQMDAYIAHQHRLMSQPRPR